MNHKVLRNTLLAAVLLVMAPAASLAAPDAAQLAQTSGELLRNPGFEGLSCPGQLPVDCNHYHSLESVYPRDGLIHDNIETPEGWVTWWRTDAANSMGQPEIVLMPISNATYADPNLPRIHSGFYAAKCFAYFRNQDAGFFQVVTGLTPGATVQLTSWGHTWSCASMNGDSGYATSCGDTWNMTMQVGIEPNGVADPFSASVIWSPEQLARDRYTLIGPLTAQVGASGTIVVILRAKSKWAVEHNDAYWDDSSLVYVGQPPAAPANPPAAVPASPPVTVPAGQPTVVTGSDGLNVRSGPGTEFAILAHVDPGTQLKITGQYTDWWQVDYNGAAGWAYNGVVTTYNTAGVPQVVPPAPPIASGPTSASPTPTPTSPPVAQPTEAVPTPVTPVAVGMPTGTSICVQAYHDRNGDTFRDAASEELLPGAELAVADASGVLARHTTDGINEPYCFPVAAGTYRVVQTPPAGYEASGQAEQAVAVAEGAILSLQFGDMRGEGAEATSGAVTPTVSVGEGGAETTGGSSAGRVLTTVAKISGILVLLLAAGMAVLFVLNRRRM